MRKALIKYLLPTFILLLCSKNFLQAHVNQNNISYSFIKNLEKNAIIKIDIDQKNQNPVVVCISSSKEKTNNDFDALIAFDDDDETISLKKHLSGANYTTPVFLTQAAEFVLTSDKKNFPLNKYFSIISSNKYLTFQVFRI
jgi:hypothetical protein